MSIFYLIIPPLSILNISNDMYGWGGGGLMGRQPWEGFDHTYFGAGFGKMENILTGNSIF